MNRTYSPNIGDQMVSIFQCKILPPKKSSIPEGSSSESGWCVLVLRPGLLFPSFECHITLSDTLVEPCRHFNERIVRLCEFLVEILIFTGCRMTEYHTRIICPTDDQPPMALVLILSLSREQK